ncbi:MAG: protein phosphatase 2C domain-containing protein [Pseudomonadales bacterium]|jgi:protein phosphatase
MSAWNDCALTHTGNVRTNNEDAFACHPELGLWVVADGMGGHEAGEIASAIAIDTITQQVRQGRDMVDAIQQAHLDILSHSRGGRGARGMGTTVVALHATDSHYRVAWVGDSRAYLWTHTGKHAGTLEQLTTDHSYVQMLVKAGTISQEEAATHREKNVITQCLGSLDTERIHVETIDRAWQPDQWLLLCSDGISDELTVEQISALLAAQNHPEAAAQALLSATLAQGGRDNATVILVKKGNIDTGIFSKVRQWLAGTCP